MPSHDTPLAPQIKPQNQGFLNFGSFLCDELRALARGKGHAAGCARAAAPNPLPHRLHSSASQIEILLLLHSLDCQMCDLPVFLFLTRAEFDTHRRDDRNSHHHISSRSMIA